MNRRTQLLQHLTSKGMNAADANRACDIAFPPKNNEFKIVYIAHPIGGDVVANLRHLREVLRRVNHLYPDVVPFCPYYANVVSLDDHDPDDRAKGLLNGQAVIRSGIADECWLTGWKMTSGMRTEVATFEEMGVPVINHLTTPALNLQP